MDRLYIRKANFDDLDKLAELMGELGYPTTIEEMKERYKNIRSNESYYTIAAEYDRKIVGMIGLNKGYFYEKNGVYVRIVALVVNKEYRNKGIGKNLIVNAEKWAVEQGAKTILLNSGVQRDEAHRFYKNIGFDNTGYRFVKTLSST